MSYVLDWIANGHVMGVKLFGRQSADDIRQSVDEQVALLNASSRPRVHILVDLYDATGPRTFDIAEVRDALRRIIQHHRMGWLLITGTHEVTRVAVAMVLSQFQIRMRVFETTEDALDFLYDIDSAVPR